MTILSRIQTPAGLRWTLDGRSLPSGLSLSFLLGMGREEMMRVLTALPTEELDGTAVAPIEPTQEVWASGVTYLRSSVERQAESSVADVYARVYEAARPEIFFKTLGRRVVGPGGKIRIRRDSDWNVPEPELVLVINRSGEIVGYTAGDDVSSRSIEGENPLYLPQAKTYDGSCAMGPGIVLAADDELGDVPIHLSVERAGSKIFAGDARTSQMKRSFADLVSYLVRETTFDDGVFLFTGTGIVPSQDFTLLPGDDVTIAVGDVTLRNAVS
ncbi:fumarylacetoacetate hydrolase family protein [Fimbriimonas ginsengisoli]|nr:fumarylacetoacetate hydrolase family protein [Fimbriimonas ginsengisoli]